MLNIVSDKTCIQSSSSSLLMKKQFPKHLPTVKVESENESEHLDQQELFATGNQQVFSMSQFLPFSKVITSICLQPLKELLSHVSCHSCLFLGAKRIPIESLIKNLFRSIQKYIFFLFVQCSNCNDILLS